MLFCLPVDHSYSLLFDVRLCDYSTIYHFGADTYLGCYHPIALIRRVAMSFYTCLLTHNCMHFTFACTYLGMEL